MDLNQKIAKIDGYYREIECELWSNVGEHWHDAGLVCYYTEGIPDYLAPENRHELERMALTIAKEKIYALEMFYDGSDWRVSLGPTVATHPIYLSIALAEVIIKAKG